MIQVSDFLLTGQVRFQSGQQPIFRLVLCGKGPLLAQPLQKLLGLFHLVNWRLGSETSRDGSLFPRAPCFAQLHRPSLNEECKEACGQTRTL